MILSVIESTESFGEVLLADGSRFKFKAVPVRAQRNKKGVIEFKYALVHTAIENPKRKKSAISKDGASK